jgi:amino acid permease (GABA permease)
VATSTEPVSGATADHEDDVAQLHSLGYAQELRRRMSGFSNFAVSFTIISILSGCLTLYSFGMNTGGPVEMVWGWVAVGVMTLVVGLGMAEICSAYPTAGGLYYWSAKLAKGNSGPAWSWFTGWFNMLGQVAVTAGIDFGFALFLNFLISLWTGWSLAHSHTIYLFAGILIVHALLNTFGVRVVAFLSDVSVWWHVIGVLVIVAVLAFVPTHHATGSFVFTKFVNQTGFHSSFYVVLIGLLMAQYTFTGYDASAHMTEETHLAAISGPRGIVNSIWVSLVAGFVLIMGVTWAISSTALYATASANPVAPGVIFQYALGNHGAEFLLLVVVVAQGFCGMASVTANSRMVYAFSRDGAVPGHRFWHRINPRTRTPTNSIWFCATFAFILGVPYLWSSTAYFAVTSIATIGLYIAYVIPTLLRRLQGKSWAGGPWSLGRWSPIIGWLGVAWVVVITVLFMLPQVSPINRDTFNYAPIAVGVVLAFSGIYWLVSARKWFKGPKAQGDETELEKIESEFANIERELAEVD